MSEDGPPVNESVTLRLKRDRRFACGTTAIDCLTGKLVLMHQQEGDTVLLSFGEGIYGWFQESVLDDFEPSISVSN
jgi:hypothetical protein